MKTYKNPRKIPFSVKFKIVCVNTILLITVALFVTCIVFINYNREQYYEFEDFGENTKHATATINFCKKIYSFGYKVFYTYEVDNKTYEGVQMYPNYPLQPIVSMVYNTKNASESALLGQISYKEFTVLALIGYFLMISVVIPFIYMSLKKPIKTLKILNSGYVTEGMLIKKKRVKSSLFGDDVYRLQFRFTAHNDKTYDVDVWTTKIAELTDDKYEKLIYDPYYPNDARIVDNLPGEAKKYISHFPSYFKHLHNPN